MLWKGGKGAQVSHTFAYLRPKQGYAAVMHMKAQRTSIYLIVLQGPKKKKYEEKGQGKLRGHI
jgi:hypothetical protein